MDRINCPMCKDNATNLNDIYHHLEMEHNESIPKNFSAAQFYYALKTGKDHGTCIICKKPTRWNEATGKYHRFCDNPNCKDIYREEFKKRMIGKYGKIHLLNDPTQQRKMLANRSISGIYKWSDGTEKTYTGSYELDGLRILDTLFNFDADDVMSPSPHTYYYEYEGETKFYIPDMFIPSLNLEIEYKDGGDNPNMHHKIQDVDKKKERLKDGVLMSQKAFSYIKIANKNYEPLFEFLLQKKNQFILGNDNEEDKPIFIVQESLRAITEETTDIIKEQLYMCPECGMIATEDIKDNGCCNCPTENLVPLNRTNKFYFELKKELGQLKYKPVGENLLESFIDKTVDPEYAALYYKLREFLSTKVPNTEAKYLNLKTIQDIQKKGHHSMEIVSSKNMEAYEVHPTVIKIAQHLCTTFGFTLKEQKKRSILDITNPEIKLVYNKNPRIEIGIDEHSLNYSIILYNHDIESTTESIIVTEETKFKDDKLTLTVNGLYPIYLLLSYRGTNVSKIIRFYTGDPYTHANISFNSDLSNMYSFGRKFKNSEVTFISEDIEQGVFKDAAGNDAEYSLYVGFFTKEQIEQMQARLNEFKQNSEKMKFNFFGLFNIAIGRETHRENEYFCSQFVAEILKAGNDKLLNKDVSLYKPFDLKDIKGFKFVMRGKLANYNAKAVEEKVKKMNP